MRSIFSFFDKNNKAQLGVLTRFALMFYMVTLLSVGIIGYYGYSHANQVYLDKAKELSMRQALKITQEMETFLYQIPNDLQFFTDFYALNRYLYWNDLEHKEKQDYWLTLTRDAFRSFFSSHDYYYKARFIDLHGKEIIKAKYRRESGKVIFEEGAELQDKSSKAYFTNALKLNRGEMYLSDIGLNAEHGRIEKPHIAVLRYSQPIIAGNGVKYGVLVLNVFAETLFDIIHRENKIDSTQNIYLLAADGNYLFHPEIPLDTGQFRAHERSYATQYPELFNKISKLNQGTLLHKGQLVSFKKVYPKANDPNMYWILVEEIDQAQALKALQEFKYFFFLLVGVVLIMVLLVARYYTKRLIHPVSAVTRQLQHLSRGELRPESITYPYSDEISQILESTHLLTTNFERLANQADTISQGDLSGQVQLLSDKDRLGSAINNMTQMLHQAREENNRRSWLKEGESQLNEQLRGEQDLIEIGQRLLNFVASYLDFQVGVFYVKEEKVLRLKARYAYKIQPVADKVFALGDGLVGQAALEQRSIQFQNLPGDYIDLTICSGLGESAPQSIIAVPLVQNGTVKGVMEFACLRNFSALEIEFLEQIAFGVAISIHVAQSRQQTQELLEQTQIQTEELQTREEELRDNNSLLEQQAGDLRRSEKILRENQTQLEESNHQLQIQQEELQTANEELEEKAADLKSSHNRVERRNQRIEQARLELEQKAEELALSSKYKSEFLANMSHELRTPLNSLLILSRLLADNQDGNLTEKQIEFSQTIHDSGSDLLTLINDILDLSKIESGKMDVYIEPVHLNDFVTRLEQKFRPLAEDKGIAFNIEIAEAPDLWHSDSQKLGQVIQNLLSNAIKFTERGDVTLHIGPVDANTQLHIPGLTPENALAVTITDSGIGIPKEKCQAIFEAFQQVDGTTSRRYGGTGLGLSISRELAKLLGGRIQVESEPGLGSTFTLYIPRQLTTLAPDAPVETPIVPHLIQSEAAVEVVEPMPKQMASDPNSPPVNSISDSAPSMAVPDDRCNLEPGDRSILIIEDDIRFATILMSIAKEHGFKILIAQDGESGLYFADYYQPSGIVLDIDLPGMDGWQVMQHLKDEAKTRHIPVHFISASDSSLSAMKNGAIGFLTKPVSMADMEQAFGRIENIIDRPVKRLLLVEDNAIQRQSMRELIGNGDVETITATSGSDAQQLLSDSPFDCIVLDLGLPDISGVELLEVIRTRDDLQQIPVVVYTGKELEPRERATLDRYAQSIIIKDARSPERLLDDTTLFLHRVESNLPEERRRMIRMLHDSESVFAQRKVLLADDDMRNVFALSAVLQGKNMQVLVAKSGAEALEKLESDPDIAIVLMDIMMPEMDGYEATRKIREQARFSQLPIIALTAKAMKGDRSQCIEAGASDYLAKPVDTKKLLSMMRVWLYR